MSVLLNQCKFGIAEGREKCLATRERDPLLRIEKIIIMGGEIRIKANAYMPLPS